MPLTRTRIRTTRFGDERTNHDQRLPRLKTTVNKEPFIIRQFRPEKKYPILKNLLIFDKHLRMNIIFLLAGFLEGWIKWDDEDTKNDNFVSGVLPDGTYSKDTVMYFCCRSDGSTETPIELPMREPFFLLKHSSSCQAVLGMRVTEEWLFWDCEDRKSKNSFDGEIPQSFIAKDVKLYFCYYIKK